MKPPKAIFRVPVFELPISVPSRGSRSRVRSLHSQLRDAIVEGRLQAGLLMPPTRALAASLGISRNSVIAAYERLLAEGYLTARQGAGTYVARVLPRAPERSVSVSAPARDRRLNKFWREPVAPWSQSSSRSPARYRFRLGVPDRTHFPFEVWRRLSARALRAFSRAGLNGEHGELEVQGRRGLREAISRHVSLARAVSCQPDDIVVTAGAQQAFDLIARILVTPGKTAVAVEEPGYPASRSVFKLAGAKIVPIPVDDEGMVVERLPATTRIICVTPSHHLPLGAVMSLRRRAALIEFARQHGAVIVEDDYDGEFRFGGGPVDALQTLDRSGCVFYVGTFSKCLFPDVRLGFVVTPAWARPALTTAKLLTDFQSPTHSQDTLAAFIDEGHLASHVRKMRRVYDERRRLLFEQLERDFKPLLIPLPSPAGLHLTALTKSLAEETRIVKVAAEHDVRLAPLRQFYSGRPAKNGIVFGYGGIDDDSMIEALERLRRALIR
jgi:GntR family transcriptional regulator/MocR family aminotransferase